MISLKDFDFTPTVGNAIHKAWEQAYNNAIKASGPYLLLRDMEKAKAYADSVVNSLSKCYRG